jgi:hypothetical protein
MSAPINTTAPVIKGSPKVAQKLTVDTGTWSGNPTHHNYWWKANGEKIAGARLAEFICTQAQRDQKITCTVKAFNSEGVGKVTTAAVGPVTAVVGPVIDDPLGVVKCYPDPFANPGSLKIIRPEFKENGGNVYKPKAGELWDLRGFVGTEHKDAKSATTFVFMDGSASAIVCGGKVYSPNNMYSGTKAGAPWNVIHGNTQFGASASGNYASLRCYRNQPGFTMHGFYLKNSMDAFCPQPDSGGAHGWRIVNFCWDEIRDDGAQDDGQLGGECCGGLIRAHVFWSWRPGRGAAAGKSGEIVRFESVIVHHDRQMWQGEDTNGQLGGKRKDKYRGPDQRNNEIVRGSTPGMGSRVLFKTHTTNDPGGLKVRTDMEDVAFIFDTPPVDGIDEGDMFPALADGIGAGSKWGSRYKNVHALWRGPDYGSTGYGKWPFRQSKQQLADMGITLHDDENEANDLAERTLKAFYQVHGYQPDNDTFSWNRRSAAT